MLYSNNTVKLATFLGTPPVSVEKKEMVNQMRPRHYRADYLYNNYSTNDNKADILTLLFPGDQNHAIGSMTRITSGSYTGCKITQGSVADVALTSGGTNSETNETESFQGENVVYRKLAGKLVSYFVKGTSFNSGQKIQTGFKSDTPVALYMNTAIDGRGSRGKIISSGSKVSFYAPDISSVRLEGRKLAGDRSEPNCVSVTIPKGTYSIELMRLSNKLF